MSTIMLSQLNEMQSVPRTHVRLYHYHFTKNLWYCQMEVEQESFKFEVKCEAFSPEEAVEKCYAKWQSYHTKGVPELKPSLLMAPTDFQEVQPPTGSDNDQSFF